MDGAHAARTVGRLIRGSKDALASFGKVSARGDTAPRAPRWGDVIGVVRGARGVRGVCVCNFPVDDGVRACGADRPEGRSTISCCLVSRAACRSSVLSCS